MLRTIVEGAPDFDTVVGSLAERSGSLPASIESGARDIVAHVRQRGDAALRELTRRFEGRELSAIELSGAEWDKAVAQVPAEVLRVLAEAATRVRDYHERERYVSYETVEEGVRLACRFSPLGRVGLYVPGGTARYPSSVLMSAVPAKVAGVGEICMATPGPSPETLAAAREAGVDRVFLIGGAQAVAALAYGTESVPRVDKIVGPGNAYVAAAKRLVFGDVGIDMVAGPTEVVIAADGSANPAWVAADLLAQAEHDVLAVPILVAVGKEVAEAVSRELERQLADLPRREIARKAIAGQGVAIVVGNVQTAVDLVNRLAPEHAGLALADARNWAARVTAAGAVFVGHEACEALGDYFAGPSHVLPTGGGARFSSPLGVGDFLKRTSFVDYDLAAVRRQAGAVACLAEVEGLAGHGRSVLMRAGRGR
ncbi:MAG: histidinol dehydrogenase [Deltaproteobacteria bacterium]|nr:histidinol dehydrogenase [Deltaproteobacteria bacterium]